MRIIAGTARGIRLGSVSEGVRPTSDRVRESVFNSLGQFFDGGSVLDLYAGTGALGIEALSRGCDRAVFVEKRRKVADTIRENIRRTGFGDEAEIVVGETAMVVERFARSGEMFDLIFADPPYRIAQQEIGGILPSLKALLTARGRIVIEGDSAFDGDEFFEARVRRYGGTFVTVFSRVAGSEEVRAKP